MHELNFFISEIRSVLIMLVQGLSRIIYTVLVEITIDRMIGKSIL
jgi:hypothetical protein